MEIANNVPVERIEKTSGSKNRCYWQIGEKSVCWVPYKSFSEKEQHIQSTIGSHDIMMCFSNELRFNSDDFVLESVSLFVPEETIPEDDYKLLNVKLAVINSQYSSFKLESKVNNFKFDLANKAIYDKDRDVLLGASEYLLENAEKTEIHLVDKDVGLYFTDENLSGWLLKGASNKVSIDFENVSSSDSSALLEIYYSIYNSQSMALMESENEEMKINIVNAIEEIKSRFVVNRGLAGYILDAFENSLDFYYG
jgi:hypothetical protein